MIRLIDLLNESSGMATQSAYDIVKSILVKYTKDEALTIHSGYQGETYYRDKENDRLFFIQFHDTLDKRGISRRSIDTKIMRKWIAIIIKEKWGITVKEGFAISEERLLEIIGEGLIEEATELRSAPWNVSHSERGKSFLDQIETSFRTIQADNKKEADAYMKKHYTGKIEKVMGYTHEVNHNKSHGSGKEGGKMVFFYTVTRKKISKTK